MNADFHERAQMLIALSGADAVPGADQSWLAAHLESCASCRQFAEDSREAIRALRAVPIAAGASLVSTTQRRVRERAAELRRRRERLWAIWVCCSSVTLCTALSTAVLWRGFAWIGQQARLPAPLWEICFLLFCFMPPILASIFLFARGTYEEVSHAGQE